jgi:predicted amidohydrolase YtcJ
MATIMAAWGGFEEKIKGSIEPGKLADMVVLGKNPLKCPPDELRTMPVELVMIGGQEKFSSSSFKGAID